MVRSLLINNYKGVLVLEVVPCDIKDDTFVTTLQDVTACDGSIVPKGSEFRILQTPKDKWQ